MTLIVLYISSIPTELVCLKTEASTKEEHLPVPKEVTVLSIDTPMAVLQFNNNTEGERENQNESQSESTMVKEFTTEIPTEPITEYRNPNLGNEGSRFRFRRPRPRPRTTEPPPVFISSTERFGPNSKEKPAPEQNVDTPIESTENNEAEQESKEVEQTVRRPERKFVKPLPLPPSRDRDIESSQSQPTSLPLPFSSTTRKYPTSIKTLRSFQQSSREAANRQSTSTATSVTYSTSTSTSTVSSTSRDDENAKVPLIRAKPATPITITPKPMIINSRPSPTIVRKASIDTKDYDDSKIPIISGVGPTRQNSEANNAGGNTNHNQSPIIKAPPNSVQTQGVLVVQPPASHPSHNHNSAIGNPRSPSLIFAEKSEIVLRDIQRTSDSIMLRWESMKPLAGYRVIYRLFGEDAFRHGPPLAPTEREYRIKHVPFNVSITLPLQIFFVRNCTIFCYNYNCLDFLSITGMHCGLRRTVR